VFDGWHKAKLDLKHEVVAKVDGAIDAHFSPLAVSASARNPELDREFGVHEKYIHLATMIWLNGELSGRSSAAMDFLPPRRSRAPKAPAI
jgi:hypothetical protein